MKIPDLFKPVFQEHFKEQPEELQYWRERIFNTITIVAASVGSVAFILNSFSQIRAKSWLMFGVTTGAFFWLLSIALLKRVPYMLRAISSIILLYLLGVSTGVLAATVGGSRIWLITAAVMATIFVSGKAGAITTGIDFITWVVLGLLFHQGILQYSGE